MGLSDTGAVHTGGVGPGGKPVTREQEGAPPQEISAPQGSWIKQKVRATDQKGHFRPPAVHCPLLYLYQVLLAPHPESWAGAGLRHLLPSLALQLMFMKPSAHVCFPPQGATSPGLVPPTQNILWLKQKENMVRKRAQEQGIG